MKGKKLRLPALGMLLVLLLANTVRGQITTGTILGTVTDQSGAVVAGAKITITNVGTEEVHEVVTDSAGNYVVPHLPVGT